MVPGSTPAWEAPTKPELAVRSGRVRHTLGTTYYHGCVLPACAPVGVERYHSAEHRRFSNSQRNHLSVVMSISMLLAAAMAESIYRAG
jgi:hypothetical protein